MSTHPNPHTHPLLYARWRLGDEITHAEWTAEGLRCSVEGEASSLTLVPGNGREWDVFCERLLGHGDAAARGVAADRGR